MLTIIRRCVACKIQVRSPKVVTLWGQSQKRVYCSCSVHNFVIPWWILKLLCRNVYCHDTKCCAKPRSVALRSRLYLEIKKIGSIFCVRSITLSFLDRFRNYFAEMLTIMRQRVARKTQVRSSKVKVTLRDQRQKMLYSHYVCHTTLISVSHVI